MENIMQHDVTAENYDRISLSDYEGGLWMSIWKVGAHCSIHLNQEQIKDSEDQEDLDSDEFPCDVSC
jgi:hypothetical protein